MGNNNNYNPFQNTFYGDLIKAQANSSRRTPQKELKGKTKTKVNTSYKKGIRRHG